MKMRPETGMEHIARDMRDGIFPQRSVAQLVPVGNELIAETLASIQKTTLMWSSVQLTYEQAKLRCHARSGLARASYPDHVFPKHHTVPLDLRVPDEWKSARDWVEVDPRDGR